VIEKSGTPECATALNAIDKLSPRLLLSEESEGQLVEVGFDRYAVSRRVAGASNGSLGSELMARAWAFPSK